MSFNPLVQGSSWSDVAKRGLHVPATKLRSKPDRKIINSVKSEVVFEVPGYTAKQISQKAAAILRRALNPDAIIFELPKGIMNPDVVVEEIEKQTGPIAGFTNLGQYRRDINNLILEIVFMQEESAKKAMTNGVTINEVVYRGSPWVDEVRRTTGSSFAFSNVTQSLRTLIATVATIFTSMNRTNPGGTTRAWSDIVKTGQTIKIPVTRRSNQATVKYHPEVVYEAPEFQHQKRLLKPKVSLSVHSIQAQSCSSFMTRPSIKKMHTISSSKKSARSTGCALLASTAKALEAIY